MARDINLLHPKVQELAVKLVEECDKKGLKIKITDTLRSESEQNSLYAQGRTKPGSVVTNAKYPCSNHNWGIAFDFCRNDGLGAYNDNDGFFAKVGQVGKSIGLSWGGDWTSFVDKPHFEYTGFGLWRALRNKYGTPSKFLGTANPTVSTGTGSNLLKVGSRGDAVKDLQTKLKAYGYYPGGIDGIFGSVTLTAVEEFQQANKLTVDGIVGDKTRAALNSNSVVKKTVAVENNKLTEDGKWGKDTTGKSQQVLGTKVDGKVSNQIVSLKEHMPNCLTSSWEFKDSGYDKGSALIKAIQKLIGAKEDGHCGPKTITAMQKFLNSKGFACGSTDGKLGKKTATAWQQYINSRL